MMINMVNLCLRSFLFIVQGGQQIMGKEMEAHQDMYY